MWSDELYKKMGDAESMNYSTNPEKAWEKMESLLDEHLPVKKKRRFIIFLLFPILLGTGVALFFIQKTGSPDPKIASQQKNNVPIQPPANNSGHSNIYPSTAKEPLDNAGIESNLSGKVINQKTVSVDDKVNKTGSNVSVSDPSEQIAGITEAVENDQYYQSKKLVDKRRPWLNQKMPKSLITTGDNKSSEKKLLLAERVETKSDPLTIEPPSDVSVVQKTITDSLKIDTVSTVNATAAATKIAQKKSSFGKKLSFNFSLGPDINSIGLSNPGKTALIYGVGVSYAVSKKLSIRSGFFAGRKKYDADSADYHPPANFWTYYSNLQKIDADCFVYEIPLSIVYNVAGSKKHNWFVAGGLSSYLMKKEEYYYHYKNAWGQPQLYRRTYKNDNSHFFSVINLSGGYQYHLNDRFTVMAEPYVRIPVNGVGYGKVKLNSGGVLFTLNVKPFLKKN